MGTVEMVGSHLSLSSDWVPSAGWYIVAFHALHVDRGLLAGDGSRARLGRTYFLVLGECIDRGRPLRLRGERAAHGREIR